MRTAKQQDGKLKEQLPEKPIYFGNLQANRENKINEFEQQKLSPQIDIGNKIQEQLQIPELKNNSPVIADNPNISNKPKINKQQPVINSSKNKKLFIDQFFLQKEEKNSVELKEENNNEEEEPKSKKKFRNKFVIE